MIIDVVCGRRKMRFSSLEKALKYAAKMKRWSIVWIDGALWLNVLEFPDGTFKTMFFFGETVI